MTEEEKWALFDEFMKALALKHQYDQLVGEGPPTRARAGQKPKVTWEQWRLNPTKNVW